MEKTRLYLIFEYLEMDLRMFLDAIPEGYEMSLTHVRFFMIRVVSHDAIPENFSYSYKYLITIFQENKIFHTVFGHWISILGAFVS